MAPLLSIRWGKVVLLGKMEEAEGGEAGKKGEREREGRGKIWSYRSHTRYTGDIDDGSFTLDQMW